MKILLITNASTPYKRPVWSLLAKEHQLTVAFEMKKSKERNALWESKSQCNYKELYMHSVFSRTSDALCLDVIPLIWRHRKNLVVIEGYSTPSGILAILFCRLFAIPYVVVCDGAMIKPEGKLAFFVKKMLLSKCRGALSSGKATTDWLMHYGVLADRIRHYPFTSVYEKDVLQDTVSDGQKQALRETLGLPVQLPIVVAVGRFIKLKNYDKLLRAWKNIDCQAYLLLIGEGEEKETYECLIREQDIPRVKLVDFLPPDILRNYYQAADLFIHTSTTEAWGLVFNEAMSCGLPCIGTDKCVGALELIEPGENGLIIPINDVQAITQGLDRLLSQPERLKAMGRRSLQKVRQFTIEKSAQMQEEALMHFGSQMKKVRE